MTLDLDGIVQVLNCHLSDTAIGMMTRIAVLKWLYHLYIKTPRKVSPGPRGLCLCLQGPVWDKSTAHRCSASLSPDVPTHGQPLPHPAADTVR